MNASLVYLAQTETTAGFLSQNNNALNEAKNRPQGKTFLISVDSFSTLKTFTRVTKNHRKTIRRASKTTFAYPNGLAIRVVKEDEHLRFLKKFKWMYSTSSNKSAERFDENFALSKADIAIKTKRGFFEATPSMILKVGKKNFKKIR